MNLLAPVRPWLKGIVKRRQLKTDMEAEALLHMENRAEDLARTGVPRREAMRRARIEFGGVESHKDAIRASIGLRFWDELEADFRFALRIMRRNPGFTLVAVLSLGVGIGVNSTLFSLADALVFRPLSVSRPEEVVTLLGKTQSDSAGAISFPDYVDFRDRSRSFDGLVAFTTSTFGFTSKPDDLPQVKTGLLVSGNLFRAMGVEPELGRGLRPEEDQVPGRDAVVVLGHDLWRNNWVRTAPSSDAKCG
jgi:macrolide transport system ATP-binding/permease protein